MSNRTTAFGKYRGFKFIKTFHGGPPAIDNVALTSGTYYPGQVLRVSNTAGKGIKAVLDCTSMAYVTSAYCATADVATPQPLYRLDDFNIFEAKMIASATPEALRGDKVSLAVASTENYGLEGTTTEAMFTIVGYDADEAVAAATGCKFWVKAARSIWASTTSGVDK